MRSSATTAAIASRPRRPGRPPAGDCSPRIRPPGGTTVVQAFILIQTEVGKAAAVAREIAQLKGVTQAEDVTGPYDVIVRAEARNCLLYTSPSPTRLGMIS